MTTLISIGCLESAILRKSTSAIALQVDDRERRGPTENCCCGLEVGFFWKGYLERAKVDSIPGSLASGSALCKVPVLLDLS